LHLDPGGVDGPNNPIGRCPLSSPPHRAPSRRSLDHCQYPAQRRSLQHLIVADDRRRAVCRWCRRSRCPSSRLDIQRLTSRAVSAIALWVRGAVDRAGGHCRHAGRVFRFSRRAGKPVPHPFESHFIDDLATSSRRVASGIRHAQLSGAPRPALRTAHRRLGDRRVQQPARAIRLDGSAPRWTSTCRWDSCLFSF